MMVAAQAFIGPALPPQWTPSEDDVELGSLDTDAAAKLVGAAGLEMEFPRGQCVGHGLHNLGNTCYMNATVQCLTHLPPLACLSLTEAHRDLCMRVRKNGVCTACVLHQRIQRGLTEPNPLFPKVMHRNLKLFAEHLSAGQQEDAHEFLVCCLDAVERDCLKLLARLNGGPFKPGQEPKTEVAEIFKGFTRSRVTCMECQAVSDKLEPFYDLSLDLQGCTSVHDALCKFTATERLDGSNLYCCDACKRKVEAEKHVAVHESSNALVIHLKRFSDSFSKITRMIEFDEVLDLGPFLTFDAPELSQESTPHANGDCNQAGYLPVCRYHLTGVIVHRGWSAHHGHYYAYVRTERGGEWSRADDHVVESVEWSEMRDDDAYVLFYCRDSQRGIPQSTDSPHCSPTTPLGSTPLPKRSWESHGSAPPSPKRTRTHSGDFLALQATSRQQPPPLPTPSLPATTPPAPQHSHISEPAREAADRESAGAAAATQAASSSGVQADLSSSSVLEPAAAADPCVATAAEHTIGIGVHRQQPSTMNDQAASTAELPDPMDSEAPQREVTQHVSPLTDGCNSSERTSAPPTQTSRWRSASGPHEVPPSQQQAEGNAQESATTHIPVRLSLKHSKQRRSLIAGMRADDASPMKQTQPFDSTSPALAASRLPPQSVPSGNRQQPLLSRQQEHQPNSQSLPRPGSSPSILAHQVSLLGRIPGNPCLNHGRGRTHGEKALYAQQQKHGRLKHTPSRHC